MFFSPADPSFHNLHVILCMRSVHITKLDLRHDVEMGLVTDTWKGLGCRWNVLLKEPQRGVQNSDGTGVGTPRGLLWYIVASETLGARRELHPCAKADILARASGMWKFVFLLPPPPRAVKSLLWTLKAGPQPTEPCASFFHPCDFPSWRLCARLCVEVSERYGVIKGEKETHYVICSCWLMPAVGPSQRVHCCYRPLQMLSRPACHVDCKLSQKRKEGKKCCPPRRLEVDVVRQDDWRWMFQYESFEPQSTEVNSKRDSFVFCR